MGGAGVWGDLKGPPMWFPLQSVGSAGGYVGVVLKVWGDLVPLKFCLKLI